jgi:hypothetical protein
MAPIGRTSGSTRCVNEASRGVRLRGRVLCTCDCILRHKSQRGHSDRLDDAGGSSTLAAMSAVEAVRLNAARRWASGQRHAVSGSDRGGLYRAVAGTQPAMSARPGF